MGDSLKRIEVEINGIVQGVGFRPFIHKLVQQYELKGYVKNTSSGVFIEAEGDIKNLHSFIEDIKYKKPTLAVIETIEYLYFENIKDFKEFKIIKSTEDNDNGEKFTLVSPDVCTCEDCLKELFDRSDPRYRFPFINCTNCGPRFTIIKNIPYDRNQTVMEAFPLCEECKQEYCDINNRRYHAQPDCCYSCGPTLSFTDHKGNEFPGDAIINARNYLLDNRIIAIKGIGGFHLAASLNMGDKLRLKKQRDHKPFAIMCKNIETIEKWCHVSTKEIELLTSYRRPIVLLKKKNNKLDNIAPDNEYLGVMLPYTPVHYLLFEEKLDTIILTSANISDIPIIYKNEEAFSKLSNIADGFLTNNRDIHVRCDDSVIRIFNDREYPIRRSRGYVPFPVKVNVKLNKLLACGGEQKASFGISTDNYVFLSPHIGDLKNIETLLSYEEQIVHYKKLFNIVPEGLVCDFHPDYLSTEYALNQAEQASVPCYMVQHHHAHMASCMADNGLSEDVIGVVWDGTGYGLDGEIWGGEFLVGGYKGFKRVGSTKEIKLPGGDKAIKEITRIGYGMLFDALGYIPDLFILPDRDKNIIESLIENNNCIMTSSIGRLFDGVAAIIGIKKNVDYEGQAASVLESKVMDNLEEYEYKIDYVSNKYLFDWHPMIRQIATDLRNKKEISVISTRFMNTLCDMGEQLVKKISSDTGLKKVVLTGGVFQNVYLLNNINLRLKAAGFDVFYHNRVSCNDEGIALGQIMIAQEGGYIKCV